MVFSPEYRGKILVEKTIAVEGIIHKICKEMKIEIIDMAVKKRQISILWQTWMPHNSLRGGKAGA